MVKTIGIIGCGNMGSAIALRLKPDYKVWAFDKDRNKTERLSHIDIADDIQDLIDSVGTLILAVKPQDFNALLSQIKQGAARKLLISIAAGISTGYIEHRLGKIRLIRAMPNLPLKIGKGMIVICKGKYAKKADLEFAQELFSHMGKTMLIEEGLMNAATAISGSGPGFFYRLIQGKTPEEQRVYAMDEFAPALSASAQEIGFNPEEAETLVFSTTQGSAALLAKSGLTPEALCAQVTSKGGTTEAGLRLLHATDSLGASVKAALKRAEELSRENQDE